RDERQPSRDVFRFALPPEFLAKSAQPLAKGVVRKLVQVFRLMIQLRPQVAGRAAIQVRRQVLAVIFDECGLIGWSCAGREGGERTSQGGEQPEPLERNA